MLGKPQYVLLRQEKKKKERRREEERKKKKKEEDEEEERKKKKKKKEEEEEEEEEERRRRKKRKKERNKHLSLHATKNATLILFLSRGCKEKKQRINVTFSSLSLIFSQGTGCACVSVCFKVVIVFWVEILKLCRICVSTV